MNNKPTYQELEDKLDYFQKNESTPSFELLINMYKNMTDGFIFLNKNWIYTYVNERAGEIYGRKPKDFIGKHIWTEFPEGINQPFYKNCYKAVETQTQINFEDYYQPWERWYENRIIPFNDGLAILFQDITDRKNSQLELIESGKKFKSIIENAGDAMYMANFKGQILEVNKLACDTLGYSKKELLSLNITELDADFVDLEKAKKFWNKLELGKPYTLETKHKRKDGSIFPVEIKIGVAIINNKKVTLGFARDISERKLAEAKIKERESSLKEAQEIAQLGSYTLDISTGFWTSSVILDNIFGIDKKYKKDISGWIEIIHPKEQDKMLAYLTKNVVANREFFDKEYRIKRFNDKQERWIHGLGELKFDIKGVPIKLIGTFQDITERKQAEIKLNQTKDQVAASEKKFRELFEKSGDAIMITKNNKIIEFNEVTVKMFGYTSKKEFLNVHPSQISPKIQPEGVDSFKKAEEMLRIAFKKGTHRFEWTHKKSNGETFPVEILLTAISNQPNNKIIHGVLRDITDRKQIESELIEAKEKAEESDRLKTEFINNMSHEIRTPMNGILGFSELLGDPKLVDKKRNFFVKIIKNSGNQLLQIIDDILEISRLGTKQVNVIEESVNLNDLLLELFSIFDKKAKENKTPLYLKKGLLDRKSIILTDRTKLNKVLSNLIENALKFTNIGFIELGYQLKTDSNPAQLEIYVKDTGSGIKLEDQKLIFERFAQAEKDELKKVKGLGLGLSIAKENTELLGGKISVESKKGKGATFFVTIPYKPVYNDIEVENIKDQRTILIVEDEEVNYLYLDTLIKDVLKLNCNLLHAKNGLEAIDICKNNPTIDFILMDLKMPIMNGYEASKEIKKMHPNIPIVAQTAYSTKEEEQRAIAAGCEGFISKPINKESLFNILTKFVPLT